MSNYTSSIVNNYGDKENLKKDANALRDIMVRQGSFLFLEVIANRLGEASLQFNLTHDENIRALNSILIELKELTMERI